jgi:hypothetical protein
MFISIAMPKIAAAIALAQGAGTDVSQGGGQQNPGYFNPQISVVGDFASTLHSNSGEQRHTDFREIEFGFAADADPFIRVIAILSVHREQPPAGSPPGTEAATVWDLEEAYARATHLGGGLSADIGKVKAAFGRVNRNHIDQLEYLDFPLVIQDVLGPEGMSQPGLALMYRFPGDRFNELTFNVLDAGDQGPVFNGSSNNHPVYVGHYRTFFDFSEDLSAQLGATYLSGPGAGNTDSGGNSYGLDYVMKYGPGRPTGAWIFEAEAYSTKFPGMSDRQFGAFARLAYEFRPRMWFTGGYDHSEIPGTSDEHHGFLAGLTYKITEFSHWRLEYQKIESNFEPSRDVLTFQLQWLIGTHPAHKY